MSDRPGEADVRGENISKVVTVLAAKKFKLKPLLKQLKSSNLTETYYEEDATILTASGTRDIKGIGKFSEFPTVNRAWTKTSSESIKYGAEAKISVEDLRLGAFNMQARTVDGIAEAIVNRIDIAIYAALTAATGTSGTVGAVATRFTTNAKSTGLTKAFLGKLGLTIGGASVLIGVIGSYPFAAFGKEEALQAMSFPMAKLIEAGKIDEAQELLDDSNLLTQEVPSKIPYKNVLDSFNNYAKAQTEANKGWQTLINNSREIAAGNETSEFEKSKEKSRQTELENMGKDAEYYKLIREGKFEEAEELRLIELEGGQ